ncbi:MAG: PHP domain-containing protein [Anaerolineae bacterium]|nr:PHP domain-containing protein [Gemmatimonadaceae bacterium]
MTGKCMGIVHVHTSYSHDCRDSLEMLRAFCLARGIGWAALTDHAEDLTPAIFSEFVARCASISDDRVTLIPGLEYRFAGFPGLHLLALGQHRWMNPETPAEFIRQSHQASRFTIAAHPILYDYQLPDAVLDGIDAVEIWNATYNTRFLPDPRAIRLLHAARNRRPEIVGTAGLDQHDSRNDRETRVMISAGESDPLLALKEGRFRNVGKTMSFDSVATMNPARFAALTLARWLFDRIERAHRLLPARAARSDAIV